MKLLKLIFISLMFFTASLFCDSPTVREGGVFTSNNNVYFSFFGDGNPVSINYERIFKKSDKLFHTMKIGLSYYLPFGSSEYDFISEKKAYDGFIYTSHLTANYGTKGRYYEFGFGSTHYDVDGDQGFIVYPILGFRVQANFGLVRFYCTPFNIIEENVDYVFPVGISFGISF